MILEYANTRACSSTSLVRVGLAFLVGWFLGVLVTGILADLFYLARHGQYHDGSMYLIAAYAIVIEAPLLAILKAIFGSRINGWFALIFGFICGPLILAAVIEWN